MSKKSKKPNTSNLKWVIQVILFTFVLSTVFYAGSSVLLAELNLIVAVVILIVIILIGLAFDMIGLAAAAAKEEPFHSMAARKRKGAAEALNIIKNRDKFSNFCSDVIGDICGIVSGSSAAFIAARVIIAAPSFNAVVVTLAVTSAVAAATIGSKAVGKAYAIRRANDITYLAARAIMVFKRKKKR